MVSSLISEFSNINMIRTIVLLAFPALASAFLLPGGGGGGCGCAPPPPPPCPPQISLPQISLPPPPSLCLPPPPPPPQLPCPPQLPPLALPSLPSGGCGCGRKKRSTEEAPVRCAEIVEIIEQELDTEDSVTLAGAIQKKLSEDFKSENVAVSCAPTKGFTLIPLEGKKACAAGNDKNTCVVFH